MKKDKTDSLLLLIRNGQAMTLRQQLRLTVELSIPSIVAQISAIAMQYIDAAMVGRLGAGAAASIGLVSTTTWLFWGTCSAAATGFSVQVAHHVGASHLAEARAVLRQAILSVSIFSLALAGIGALISGSLPVWLGGTEEINRGASAYFLIFALSLPLLQLNFLAGSMLRCSGNMRVPGLLNVLMCLLDVVFNFFLIFPTREVEWFGLNLHMPGAGLGVTGAALGTAAAEAVVAGLMMWYLIARSNDLKLKGERGSFRPTWGTVRKALHKLAETAVLTSQQGSSTNAMPGLVLGTGEGSGEYAFEPVKPGIHRRTPPPYFSSRSGRSRRVRSKACSSCHFSISAKLPDSSTSGTRHPRNSAGRV